MQVAYAIFYQAPVFVRFGWGGLCHIAGHWNCTKHELKVLHGEGAPDT